jgi:hypothetical protein
MRRTPRRGSASPGAWAPPLAAVVTVAVLVLGSLAPLVPVTADEHAPWNLVQRALAFEAERSLPGWWSTVLPVLVAAACLDAAGRRRAATARGGWVLLAALLGWLSLDHLVTIHEAMSRLHVAPLGPLAGRPVETALVVLGAVVGGLLVRREPRGTVVLLALAALAYTVSALVDALGVPVTLSTHHTAMVEVGTSWVAFLLALRAARADLAVGLGAARVRGTRTTPS